MKASSGSISIAANARKLDVDHRISLRYYYRIADNLLKQANVYREEKNVIDQYIMLLRFSSLVTETIPCHQDYQLSLPKERQSFKKKLLSALSELETLNPVVKRLLDEVNKTTKNQVDSLGQVHQNASVSSSLEWAPQRTQSPTNYDITQVYRSDGREGWKQNEFRRDKLLSPPQFEEQFRKLSLSILRPKEETLSRHSILGPNGLRGEWQAPTSDRGVQYPSNLDLTPIEIPSLNQFVQNESTMVKESENSAPERSTLESVLSLDDGRWSLHADESCSVTTVDTVQAPIKYDIIRQPSPPPVLANVQDLVPVSSLQFTEPRPQLVKFVQDGLAHSESPIQLYISVKMMDDFMRLAKSNTQKNLETCGVLAGSLKAKTFYVTTLIIPKQESTSDSCQTMNEEEIYDIQDTHSLFPLGWIHTHPSQSCFMSSIDLHTHYSYQIMLPEAIAIVMAPTDTTRTHGIFRLSDPSGISVIRNCQQRGFHPHDEPPDGSPIYETCSHVYMDTALKFDVIDLR